MNIQYKVALCLPPAPTDLVQIFVPVFFSSDLQ